MLEERDSGRYRILPLVTDHAMRAVDIVFRRTDGLEFAHELRARFTRDLDSTANADFQLRAALLASRHAKIQEIRALVDAPGATEADAQKALRGQWWIFGGAYMGESARRRLLPSLEIDIPLLRPGGILHLVELKGPGVTTIKRHRPHIQVTTSDVNDAVGQVAGYLRMLDEKRDDVLARLKIDTRRCGGTVVIGDPTGNGLHGDVVSEVLRGYNSHLSRIDVVTYGQLLDSAERGLSWEVGELFEAKVDDQ
ncbi:MAG: Shedu anti-phage system protein SduA domain-containing protein [Frankia sp.]